MLAAYYVSPQLVLGLALAAGGVGALCTIGYVVSLGRRGRLRNPLRDAGPPPPIGLAGAVVAMFAYLLLLAMLLSVAYVPKDESHIPGSHAFHVGQTIESAARLAVSGLMMFWLWRAQRQTAAASRVPWHVRVARVLGRAVLATLVIETICTTQLQMSSVLWLWLHRGAELPTHPVLLALENTAWGAAGRWQLSIQAMLVAPLSEELFFRGLVLGMLWHYTGRAWVAVAGSAVLFGAMHQPQDILPLCTMGLILGYIRVHTGSLSTCVLAHALFNSATMVAALWFPQLL